MKTTQEIELIENKAKREQAENRRARQIVEEVNRSTLARFKIR